MKEIKYLSHFLRNIYLFFIFIFSVSLINRIQLNFSEILIGLLTYFISYLPVYFVNDYADHIEDKKYGKDNLYENFKNKSLFWTITSTVALFGIALTARTSLFSLTILAILYFLNIIYSLEPFKLRNKSLIREITIFLIYFLKMIYLGVMVYSTITILPILIIIMSASTGAFSVSLYKRHSKRTIGSELLFGFIFTVSWILTELLYKQTFFLFLPLLPAVIFLAIKYKKQQIPIGIFQTIYFFYVVIVYFFMKI